MDLYCTCHAKPNTYRVPVSNDQWLQSNDSAKVCIQHLHQLSSGQAPDIQVLSAEVESITISLQYYKGGKIILIQIANFSPYLSLIL
jgi:hypothetical protein